PLANFYVKDASTKDTQLMTIHLQHLKNTNSTVSVNIVDKSRPSMTGTKVTQWRYKIYDPKNNVVQDQTVSDLSQIKDYTFNQSSLSGRWTFELTVKDDNNKESKVFQTYATAFLDNEEPIITGENSKRNVATITLTDTGMGIDDDGITFIEDHRGSGVAAYWVTNDPNAVPTEKDWINLDAVQHSYSFDYPITSTEPLVVWVKDECKNIGNKAVFQPTHVVVEDEDGNPIDDYYVIDKNPIIVLPEDEPDPDDPNKEFGGWVIPGTGDKEDDPITPGTTPTPDKDNTITIRPSFTEDKAAMVYVANGGEFTSHADADKPGFTTPYTVAAGASIETKVEKQNVEPKREGYEFVGWKLLDSNDEAKAQDSAYIAAAGHLQDVKEKLAECKVPHGADGVKHEARTTYYLIAQWEIKSYTLHFDANGGKDGKVRSISNINYETNIGSLDLPNTGRDNPTKEGYLFQGWSVTKNNDKSNIFKFANGVSGTAVTAPTMPAGDLTVYAVWMQDPNKFVVSFDSDGGSKVKDQSYELTNGSSYAGFATPTKAGYTFNGWYLQEEDGSVGTTEYKGTEAFAKKANHTFVAKWEANEDTPYTVDYYVNSGKKDTDGKDIYVKANGMSVAYTGKTGTKASIAKKDMLEEFEYEGRTYWYDAENKQNTYEGEITGNPTLSLKLYY
ncbi:InlB B-repeat-containing protein, partial [Ihubacter sp. mB4P-1]